MNLTPVFAAHHLESVHWSAVGDPKADDSVIMCYALDHAFVIFAHDLDFGSILAVTHARGPSVIQARVEDPVPAAIGSAVVAAIGQHAHHLERGALITLDPNRLRTRILPLLPGLR